MPATKVAPGDPGVLVTPKGYAPPTSFMLLWRRFCPAPAAYPPPGWRRAGGGSGGARGEARICTGASPRHARPARLRTHVDAGAAAASFPNRRRLPEIHAEII